jgi:hypothetical protein
MAETGEAFGVECPIMMHDRRLLNLDNKTINTVLMKTDNFYGNHDLWHNMIPVYANSFILHHPDAPLSHGGRLDAYNDFGAGLRSEKEEYEIGVAMAHSRTQLERFQIDPELRSTQEALILDSLDLLSSLPSELAETCTPEEIENIVDYLACRAATKAYNVFPDDDPIYVPIKQKLECLGIKPLDVGITEIVELLLGQKLVDPTKVNEILPDDIYKTDKDKLRAVTNDVGLGNRLIKECIDDTNASRESGSEHIVSRLRDWGVLNELSYNASAKLDVLQKSRWLAIVGPQRQQLRGHMEKVHGKPGYLFNGDTVSEPRDLALIQKAALDTDKAEYEYRIAARTENQKLSYEIYSLLFDDGQALHANDRSIFDKMRENDDVGQKLFAREAVAMLDKMMDELVHNTYSILEEQTGYLRSFVASLEGAEMQSIKATVTGIIDRYTLLATRERDHQDSRGINYASATQRLVEENMTIA